MPNANQVIQVERNDRPRAVAEEFIDEAIGMLWTARSKGLVTSDNAAAKIALDSLGMIKRWIARANAADDSTLALKLHQIANDLNSSKAQPAKTARAEIQAAASIFRSMADEADQPIG